MTLVETDTLSTAQKEAAYHLWNGEYPVRLHQASMAGFERYLGGLSEPYHFLLMNEAGRLAGWCFSFYRDEERWFGIIVGRTHQGQGIGTQLLGLLKQRHLSLNGWVIDHDYDKKTMEHLTQAPCPFTFARALKRWRRCGWKRRSYRLLKYSGIAMTDHY